MLRRLDLAMTLVGSPQVIFLDEPTTGLDPRSRRDMWQIVRDLVAGGVTIFLTTQYLEEADELADRMALLDHGRLVAEGTADQLKRRIPGGHIRLQFADAGELDLATRVLGEVVRDDNGLTLQVPHDGGVHSLRALLARLDAPWVVLGNHDHAVTRDPFSRSLEPWRLGGFARLLADESVDVDLRGCRVELAGVDARSWLRSRSVAFPPSDAPFRILLCHFPRALDFVQPGRFDLILAGHLHAGQIVVPYLGGKLLLAHPRAPYTEGVYVRGTTTMHVSPGLGTTFLPLRIFARPEATELVLRRGHAGSS
jgi:hypothetical protein